MNGIYYYLIAFIVIWILAFGLKEKLNNHGFEINFPLIMWRTERFKNFIEKLANRFPRFWKCFMNLGVVISYIAMIFITWTIVSSLASVLETPSCFINYSRCWNTRFTSLCSSRLWINCTSYCINSSWILSWYTSCCWENKC